MATIFDFVSLDDSKRPVYTSYELSKAVKEKRKNENLDVHEFALEHDADVVMLEQIEEASRVFTPDMYRACAKILNISIDEIVKVENDDLSLTSFRTTDGSEKINCTVNLANKIFNEIIMQKKISVN